MLYKDVFFFSFMLLWLLVGFIVPWINPFARWYIEGSRLTTLISVVMTSLLAFFAALLYFNKRFNHFMFRRIGEKKKK